MKSDAQKINETVLEMHYHKPMMDLMRESLGVGKGQLEFYKYSPQKECYIGFDQAYAKSESELSDKEFFELLSAAAASTTPSLGDKFLGYFLQFKVVRQLSRSSRYTPKIIVSKPHFRCSLETTKNASSGYSQHELLFNLNKNPGAMVYYACPMLFERESLYESVDMDTLRLADVDTCPSSYSDNENHFIYFDDATSDPVWCSEPTEGEAIEPSEFVSQVGNRLRELSPARSAQDLLQLLTGEGLELAKSDNKVLHLPVAELMSDSLTILRIRSEKGPTELIADASHSFRPTSEALEPA